MSDMDIEMLNALFWEERKRVHESCPSLTLNECSINMSFDTM
jgi:hypothetical protein